ncbi:secreted RxLR effector protein 161-like [Cryptomeria japonica]|uniref:secreted RxLR effector protein 161-like n=1 Tax=Cryptomeria japonica TaxID=3369 RepID=UPI0027DA8FFD|nr:secreted RxLR effector protein 161-like [Cryptomeria japonica]
MYITTILERFNLFDCKQLVVLVLQGMKLSIEDCPKYPSEMEDMSKVPYASAVGSLTYAIVYTRLDIAQVVGVLSRFMANLGRLHWDAMKKAFICLRGTSQYALYYHGNLVGSLRTVNIQGYVDSDWVGDIDNNRSTNGYVFTLNGGAISWMGKRQVVVALSTTKAEYMEATRACQEDIWLKRLCSDVGFNVGQISMCCDS